MEVNGKKYRVLRSYLGNPPAKGSYIKRNDGTIFIVDEIKDIQFEDIKEDSPVIQ